MALAHLAVTEAGTARFRVNFGSPMCEDCEGLRAGLGVTATCFQVKRCFYTNVKASDASPKQLRVIDTLMGANKPLT